MGNIFDRLNYGIRGFEGSLVNLLSTLTPWLAPLIPAYMTYTHVNNYLDFPHWVALIAGITVEFLGLTTVSTTLAFWSHNQKYKTDVRRVPVIIPLLTFVFYLLVVISINVLLDVYGGQAVIAVRVLLTLLSVPAAVIIATRRQHGEIIDEIRVQKDKRAIARREKSHKNINVLVEPPLLEAHGKGAQERISDYLKEQGLAARDVGKNGSVTPAQISETLGIKPNTVRPTIKRLKEKENEEPRHSNQ